MPHLHLVLFVGSSILHTSCSGWRRIVLQVNTALLVFPALVAQVLLGAVPTYAFLPARLLLCQSLRFDRLLQKTFPPCFWHPPSYRRAFCIHKCNTSFCPPETLQTIPTCPVLSTRLQLLIGWRNLLVILLDAQCLPHDTYWWRIQQSSKNDAEGS